MLPKQHRKLVLNKNYKTVLEDNPQTFPEWFAPLFKFGRVWYANKYNTLTHLPNDEGDVAMKRQVRDMLREMRGERLIEESETEGSESSSQAEV